MKRTLLFAVLLGVGLVSSSHAVVIHWAASVSSGLSYSSAQLVYVAGGTWNGTYTTLGTAASGGALVAGLGVRERSTTDTQESGGAYFVVLFNSTGTAMYRSDLALAYNDTSAITYDVMNPASGVFNPTQGNTGLGVNGWQPVPEPTTGALACIGAAVIIWRRRRKHA